MEFMELSWLKSEWAYFSGALVTLIFIIDPFAAIPAYLTLTERFSADDRKVISQKATFYALFLLVMFALTGMKFFSLFGISLPAFQIAGGILLLVFGMSQMNANRRRVTHEEEDESLHRDDVTVFPLATPLLAGPGAISTVILLSTEAGSWPHRFVLVAALCVCMAAVYVVLRSSPYLNKVLGRTGLTLLSRVTGIVLTAVAVQFILNGIKEVLIRMGHH